MFVMYCIVYILNENFKSILKVKSEKREKVRETELKS